MPFGDRVHARARRIVLLARLLGRGLADGDERVRELRGGAPQQAVSRAQPGLLPCLVWIAAAPASRAAGAP